MDIDRIREHFRLYEHAYQEEFGYDFEVPGGFHAPSPFSNLEMCVRTLVDEGEISLRPAMVMGFGDARAIMAFNRQGIDAYGLEKNEKIYWIGSGNVGILKDEGLTHPDADISLGHGDFYDLSSYEKLCVHLSIFGTFYHYAGTGEFLQEQAVANLVSRESKAGSVFLLANHTNMPYSFEGFSCNRTYRLWGVDGRREGMFVHVYKKSSVIEEIHPMRKKAIVSV